MAKLKRFSTVHIKPTTAKVLNPVREVWWDEDGTMHDEGIKGYRCTDGRRPAYWFVVPTHMIEECDED